MASEYIARLDATAEDLFYHALAVLHAPLYRDENAGALRQDWPRVPLPEDREVLLASAELGRQVALLLDTEREAPGVAARAGAVRPELRSIGPVTRVGGGSLGADDLSVTAGWGHGGNGRAVMPARGRAVERAYTVEEREAMAEGAGALGLTPEDAARLLGAGTYDIYLNDAAYWRNVPARVWDYTIGGYQVLKKWLSYRERGVLGRALTPDEAREAPAMARRIAAILLLGPRLDASYAAAKEATLTV